MTVPSIDSAAKSGHRRTCYSTGLKCSCWKPEENTSKRSRKAEVGSRIETFIDIDRPGAEAIYGARRCAGIDL